jgi:hypothetical protein
MDNNLTTNAAIFESIVEDSYTLMLKLIESGRTPKEGGGYILKYDPGHQSIKEAFKVLLFVGATIEAIWHQKAVELKSKSFAEKKDKECKSVPLKLAALGIEDQVLLEKVRAYYSVRREIVHEKAHLNSYQKNIFVAQKEAEEAVSMLASVKLALNDING